MRWAGTCYRAHDPRWAFAPLSGDGAAAVGARFNPIGVPALYLALSMECMFAEIGHRFIHRFDPLTICSYDVDVDGIADLRTLESRAAAGVALDEMACDWVVAIARRKRPESWDVAEKLMRAGHSGILTPSFARGAPPGMANLVLWRWGPDLPHRVSVNDPAARLPKDQSSWT